MNRAQTEAHLTLHGWVPVMRGVTHAQHGTIYRTSFGKFIHATSNHVDQYPELDLTYVDWRQISDPLLNVLVAYIERNQLL